MITGPELAIYGSLLLSGLAGSLHCISMCGPILLSFSQLFEAAGGRRHTDFVWYHAGRIWTYGAMGFLVGWLGRGLRDLSGLVGWQQTASILVGAGVIVTGLVLFGVIPGLRLDALTSGCAVERLRDTPWFRTLLGRGGPLPRLLLGATMGLLPCGLVYAMLVVTLALPGPFHSALGMVVFGVGTVPSLSAVLLLSRSLPARLRVHGKRLAAIALVLAGSWMTARAIVATPGEDGVPACHAPAESVEVAEPEAGVSEPSPRPR